MRNPSGFRADSVWTPNASRAGALHSHIHIHLQRQNSRPEAASMTSGRGLAGVMDGDFVASNEVWS